MDGQTTQSETLATSAGFEWLGIYQEWPGAFGDWEIRVRLIFHYRLPTGIKCVFNICECTPYVLLLLTLYCVYYAWSKDPPIDADC